MALTSPIFVASWYDGGRWQGHSIAGPGAGEVKRFIELKTNVGGVIGVRLVNPDHIVLIGADQDRPDSPVRVVLVTSDTLAPEETLGEIRDMIDALDGAPDSTP